VGFNFKWRCDAAWANDELKAGFLACFHQVGGPSGSAAPMLEAVNELTASFSACFYPVRWLSVHGAPVLDPNSVEVNCNQQLDLRNFVALA